MHKIRNTTLYTQTTVLCSPVVSFGMSVFIHILQKDFRLIRVTNTPNNSINSFLEKI